MAHFMDCILSDQEQKIAVDRDYRTGVNYLCWFETNDGGRVLHRWYCPMFGADGKPLVTDIAGNIRPEQQFNEKEFISSQGLTENNDKKHFEKYCRRIGIDEWTGLNRRDEYEKLILGILIFCFTVTAIFYIVG